MSRRALDEVVAVVYAIACLAVVLAPALAVHWAATHGGMGDLEGADLVAASAVVGSGQAVVAWARLRAEERTAVRRTDMWIAAGNALVILALGATVLLVLVLHGFPDEHASMARRGYPVVALWAGVQLVAVALAELTGRLVFWWLEPHAPTRGLCRWGVLRWRPHPHVVAPRAVEVVARPRHPGVLSDRPDGTSSSRARWRRSAIARR